MNCANARPKLQELLDGSLTAAEAEPLRAHLASCAACRRASALFSLSTRSLARLPERSPRPGFDSRVLAAAAAARRAAALPRWTAIALNAAATATALWTAALAAFARPTLGASSIMSALRAARHPGAFAASAELTLARAAQSLPEGLRAARRAAAVFAHVRVAPGASLSAVPLELAAAAVLAALAVAAIARPRPIYAVNRRTP